MVNDVSSQIVPRYNSSYNENIVLYYIGYNDTWEGTSLNTTTLHNRLVTYYNTLKSAGFKVLMINLPDGFNRIGISKINSMYAAQYADICDAFVNCRQTAGVFEDYNNTIYYRDNVHLSITGLNYLAQNYVYSKLTSLINAPGPSLPPATSLLTGLESYYKFDETSGTVKDETGANHGTSSLTTSKVAGKIGGAYYFDSNTDYIALSKPYTLKTATYSFWMKISSITDDLILMANDAYYSRIFVGANNNLKLETNSNGQEFAFYSPFTANTWYHITLVRDNDYLTVYKNGAVAGTAFIGGSASLTFSQIGFNGRSFRGTIDEVGIWSRALNSSEIRSVYQGSYPFSDIVDPPAIISVTGITINPSGVSLALSGNTTLAAIISPQNATNKNVTWRTDNESVATVNAYGLVTALATGNATITATAQDGGKVAMCRITVAEGSTNSLMNSLRAYYKFDETSGNAKDEAGSNTGIVSAGVGRVEGRINGAYHFDSNSDFIALSSSITHKTATYSFWLKLLSITDDLLIMGSNPYQSRIFIGANNNLKLETNTNGQEFAFYNEFNTGTWYHIALVRNNDNLLYYRNGTLLSTASISNSNHITLSHIGFNGRSFRGMMDEVGIWDRALSSEEVALLNNGLSYPFNQLKSTDPQPEKEPDNDVLFYPNPATKILYLTSPDLNVEIYDLKGRLLLNKENQNEIDLTGINTGLYVIRIRKNNDVISRKLLIE
jgi:hypothetical protein